MSKYEKYTLKVGAGDAERLRLLNQVLNPFSLRFLKQLGNLSGKHVLDLGCGTGIMSCELAKLVGPAGKIIAADISNEQIEIAKKNAAVAGLNNIEFVELAAADVNTLSANFDLIYCRLVLAHLADPISIIKKMISRLSFNGYLISEEPIDAYKAMFCYPSSEAFEQFKEICLLQQKAFNTDFSIGKKLYEIFREENLRDIHLEIRQPIILTAEEKKQFWLGVDSISEPLIKAKLATEEQITATIAALKKFCEEDNYLIGWFQYLQIAGKKM